MLVCAHLVATAVLQLNVIVVADAEDAPRPPAAADRTAFNVGGDDEMVMLTCNAPPPLYGIGFEKAIGSV